MNVINVYSSINGKAPAALFLCVFAAFFIYTLTLFLREKGIQNRRFRAKALILEGHKRFTDAKLKREMRVREEIFRQNGSDINKVEIPKPEVPMEETWKEKAEKQARKDLSMFR